MKMTVFGVTGIREYPDGRQGAGDVDSGPLFFGLSPAGTGFAIAGARFTRDAEFLNELLLTAEIAGCTIETGGRRRYLLAPLVGDAVLLAMRSVTEWNPR